MYCFCCDDKLIDFLPPNSQNSGKVIVPSQNSNFPPNLNLEIFLRCLESGQNKTNQTLITMKNLIPTNQPQHQPIKLEKACLTLFVIISYASL